MPTLFDAQELVEYQAKQWSKNHMLPYNPEWLHHPVSKKEYDNAPKTEGFKMQYDLEGKTYYGYYSPIVEKPKKEVNEGKPKIKLVTNIAKTQEEANKVIEQFNIQEIEDYLDKVIIGGGPKVLAAVQTIVAQYGPPEVKVKKPIKSVARKATTKKKVKV